MSRPEIAAITATPAASSPPALSGFPTPSAHVKGYAQRLAEAMKIAIDAELAKIE